MLAGCSSPTLLSPRQRLRSEATAQFQVCHFPPKRLELPSSMSTQRLELPCNFPRKDTTSRSQSIIRPVGVSVENSIEPRTISSSCSLKQQQRKDSVKEETWETSKKNLKRLAAQVSFDEASGKKQKKGIRNVENFDDLGQLGSGICWFNPNFEVPASAAGISRPQVPFSLSYAGADDEERVCFVPSEIISSPLNFSNNPDVTSLVEKNDAQTSHGSVKEVPSGSISSSDSDSLDIKLSENTSSEHGTREHEGLELVSLLMSCVESINSRNIMAIHHFIAKLGSLASPKGAAPINRIIAYFTEALALRVSKIWPNIFHITIPRELDYSYEDNVIALRLFNQVTPIPKFIHFTSNEFFLRAFAGKDRVHIIDLDIKQGLQWPSLFQSLASRTNPPSHVRITGVGESKLELQETGDRLSGFADALSLPFEFHPVVDRLEDVRLWMLHVKKNETIAVNCASQLHKTLYDRTGHALRDVLGTLKSANPAIVVMAEQESEHKDINFGTRVCRSLKYYSSLFDALDFSLDSNSLVRNKIEEVFAREIRNVIACEGRERYERHSCFGTWRTMMVAAGLRCIRVTEREILQSEMLLRMYASENYRVQRNEEDGGDAMAITLSWEDQPLYSVSAWTPAEGFSTSIL